MIAEAPTTAREFATDRLRTIVEACKADGLQVWTFVGMNDGPVAQVFITDGTGIASVQDPRYDGFRISTVHKPCCECGTGFGDNTKDGATVADVRAAMAQHAPNWATKAQRAAVKKYSSWAEYLERETILDYYQL